MKIFFLILILISPLTASAFMDNDRIAFLQQTAAGWPVGDRIAFWAEQFVDVPYDIDPDGEYVTRGVIVSDARVDCMYHVFRSVELALGRDPADSVSIALDKRFHNRGLTTEGKVRNYEERFRYGEDMIDSGKWGREVTSEAGRTSDIRGARGRDRVKIILKKDLPKILGRLKNGDLIFFIKEPAKRRTGEIVGHMGIIKIENDEVYLVNASGRKNRGGKVKKTLFSDYNASMPFIGVRISRMQ